MTTPGIEFQAVWKKFRRGEMHDSLRDLVPSVARRLVGRGPRRDELQRGDFWALRDITFSVQPGQALGIIGPNGAGKSTILKTLTRILRPTRGYCRLTGRAGSLIEVAAGFHPDLTGRENVFLQGAIMGMTSRDIAKKFDQIVEFSGITDFIDTPVKRYSSGMNARLGFSIAAHLDPDVLVIDEVLSVGDFTFQSRAFDRIRQMVGSGIPVVVVSHQLDRISELCTHALLLSRGQVVRQGTAAECIAAYVLEGNDSRSVSDDGPLRIDSLELLDAEPVRSGERVRIGIRGVIADEGLPGHLEGVCLQIRSSQTGTEIFSTSTARCGLALPARGPFELEISLQMNVQPGIYGIESMVWDHRDGRVTAQGPNGYVQVLNAAAEFVGTVQMNPTMRLSGAGGPALPSSARDAVALV